MSSAYVFDSTVESINRHYRELSIAQPVSGHSSEGIDAGRQNEG